MKYLLIAAMMAPVAPAGAPISSLSIWAADWRLDRASSRLRGEVISIGQSPQGYRFDFGAVQFTLPDDGRFHPTIAGRETRLAKLGPLRWEREHRINGKVVDRSILTVASNGRRLTIAGTRTITPPEVLTRVGSGSGLAGSWRSTRLGGNVAEVLSLSTCGGSRLQWGSPSDGNYYLVTLGAGPAVNQGRTASPSATLQIAKSDDRSLRWIERVNKRPYRVGIDRLSADGNVLTETAWPVALPGEKQVLVYRRPLHP